MNLYILVAIISYSTRLCPSHVINYSPQQPQQQEQPSQINPVTSPVPLDGSQGGQQLQQQQFQQPQGSASIDQNQPMNVESGQQIPPQNAAIIQQPSVSGPQPNAAIRQQPNQFTGVESSSISRRSSMTNTQVETQPQSVGTQTQMEPPQNVPVSVANEQVGSSNIGTQTQAEPIQQPDMSSQNVPVSGFSEQQTEMKKTESESSRQGQESQQQDQGSQPQQGQEIQPQQGQESQPQGQESQPQQEALPQPQNFNLVYKQDNIRFVKANQINSSSSSTKLTINGVPVNLKSEESSSPVIQKLNDFVQNLQALMYTFNQIGQNETAANSSDTEQQQQQEVAQISVNKTQVNAVVEQTSISPDILTTLTTTQPIDEE